MPIQEPALEPGLDPLVQRLAAWVAFDTQNPAGDEAPMAEALAAQLRGLHADSVEVLAVGRHRSVFARFGATPPRLLINAHIDTVPANSGYSRPAHDLQVVKGRCYGLGSADTKGAIAAVLQAIADVQAMGRSLNGVGVLFSGDEELGGTCVRDFLARGLGEGVERAIACEPTGCRVGTRHRGIASATARVTSPGGHSSLADTLPAPIAVLARAAVALDDMGRRYRDEGPPGFTGLCMNVASINGGLAFNVIPSAAELAFSMRPAPGAQVGALLEEAQTAIRRAADPEPVTWSLHHNNPPFATHDPAAFGALFDTLGGAALDLAFWTEAALFAECGINAVVFGPGHIEQAHAADEFVEVAQLTLARDAFVRLLLS